MNYEDVNSHSDGEYKEDYSDFKPSPKSESPQDIEKWIEKEAEVLTNDIIDVDPYKWTDSVQKEWKDVFNTFKTFGEELYNLLLPELSRRDEEIVELKKINRHFIAERTTLELCLAAAEVLKTICNKQDWELGKESANGLITRLKLLLNNEPKESAKDQTIEQQKREIEKLKKALAENMEEYTGLLLQLKSTNPK